MSQAFLMRAAVFHHCMHLSGPPFLRRRHCFLRRFLKTLRLRVVTHLHRCRHPEVWVYKLHQAADVVESAAVIIVADTADMGLELNQVRLDTSLFKTLVIREQLWFPRQDSLHFWVVCLSWMHKIRVLPSSLIPRNFTLSSLSLGAIGSVLMAEKTVVLLPFGVTSSD